MIFSPAENADLRGEKCLRESARPVGHFCSPAENAEDADLRGEKCLRESARSAGYFYSPADIAEDADLRGDKSYLRKINKISGILIQQKNELCYMRTTYHI